MQTGDILNTERNSACVLFRESEGQSKGQNLMTTESADKLPSNDERQLKDLLLPVRDIKNGRKRNVPPFASLEVTDGVGCKHINEAAWDELEDGEKVALLMLKESVDAVEFSKNFHTSMLKLKDFENILKYVVVDRSDWMSLLRVHGLDSRYPKTLEKRLPNDFCEILRSCKQESFRICPGFYCLVDGCFGSIVIARWTKQLCEELTRCRVHGCVCKRCDEVKGEI